VVEEVEEEVEEETVPIEDHGVDNVNLARERVEWVQPLRPIVKAPTPESVPRLRSREKVEREERVQMIAVLPEAPKV
jgi:hypothetical protein